MVNVYFKMIINFFFNFLKHKKTNYEKILLDFVVNFLNIVIKINNSNLLILINILHNLNHYVLSLCLFNKI